MNHTHYVSVYWCVISIYDLMLENWCACTWKHSLIKGDELLDFYKKTLSELLEIRSKSTELKIIKDELR